MKNKRIEFNKVKAIKNHTASTIKAVHAVSFAVFDILYIILDRFLKIYLPDIWWGDVLKALFVAGAYYVIYEFIKGCYSLWIICVNPQLRIAGGEWYHVHIPNDNGEKRCYLSGGTTKIKRELNDFTFSSYNYNFYVNVNEQGKVVVKSSPDSKTHWYTETSEICDGNDMDIVEVYKAQSDRRQMIETLETHECPFCKKKFEKREEKEEAGEFRYGIHKYTTVNKEFIICEYSDCYPSRKSGKLYLYRKESERNKKILEYFGDNKTEQKLIF